MSSLLRVLHDVLPSMRDKAALLLLATASFLVAGCIRLPTVAKYTGTPTPISSDGPYVHPASSIVFPQVIGEFRRAEITQFDDAEKDVGVAYNLVNPSTAIAATVYVYPGPRLIVIGSPRNVVAEAQANLMRSDFQHVQADILHAHPGASLVSKGEANIPRPDGVREGLKATYEYEEVFAGQRQMVLSHVYLFDLGKWYLKYRMTHPKRLDWDVSRKIDEFIHFHQGQ